MFMKALMFTFVIISAGTMLHAQENLSDRWKETGRLDLSGKPVTYTDTLRLLHVTKETMEIRKGSFAYKGEIMNDVVQVGDMMYGLMKNDPKEIHLRDEEFTHVFTREVKDMTASDAAVSKLNVDLPSSPVTSIDKNLLKGKWEAYKRSNRNGPAKVDYKTLIKTLTWNDQKNGDYYGAATIDFVGGNTVYYLKDAQAGNIIAEDKDKKEQKLKVWRLTADELVIEDGAGLVYYMKHFR
jgi:hypothetical protein